MTVTVKARRFRKKKKRNSAGILKDQNRTSVNLIGTIKKSTPQKKKKKGKCTFHKKLSIFNLIQRWSAGEGECTLNCFTHMV